MKDYAMIGLFKPIKGVFFKEVAGEFLMFAWKNSKAGEARICQFFLETKPGMYVVGVVGGVDSPDDDALEEIMDSLRYSGDTEILEDKLPIKIKTSSGFKILFEKPSKYLGSTLELHLDSRLPPGYYMAICKIKKGFDPAVQGERESNTPLVSDLTKRMRSFTSSRIKNIIKK